MIERTFRKPSAREVFEFNKIAIPSKINDGEIMNLIDKGILSYSGCTYKSSVEKIEKLEKGKIALFSSRFRVDISESNRSIKSLEGLMKIDSANVLREIDRDAPHRFTKKFLENNKVWPYTLIKKANERQEIENPSMGFYWVGGDNHIRATTWTRAVAGAEMKVMKDAGDFGAEVLDKVPYGKSLRMKVCSRDEDGIFYGPFDVFGLPMFKRGDIEQYSGWINLDHNSNDPDASYRGSKHRQRKFGGVFWSASTIFAFYNAMTFVKKLRDKEQFRINPFPIPANGESIGFIDKLRLQSLIFHRGEKGFVLDSLNKSEMDKIIGARTILRGYDSCWVHWGKMDLSYLYQPGDE
ncbi:MAG: hypothetical protein AABW50_03970 [Nanoarchaeota archaeon]